MLIGAINDFIIFHLSSARPGFFADCLCLKFNGIK